MSDSDTSGTAESEAPRPDATPKTEPAAAAAEASTPPWKPSPHQLHVAKDAEGWIEAGARRFAETAQRAVERNDRFIVVLAGGGTPAPLYRALTEDPWRSEIPWHRTFFVFGDERCVAPDHEDSNYRLVRETLFDPLEIHDHQVLRMKGEQAPADAARRYEVRLGDLFLNLPKRHFDLALLGVGTDGHTASLFPGSPALEETERWVAATEAPDGSPRLTLTYPALNSSRRVLFLVTGEAKAEVVARAFAGVEHPEPYPCERIAPPQARREVLLDAAAASEVPDRRGGRGGEGSGSK